MTLIYCFFLCDDAEQNTKMQMPLTSMKLWEKERDKDNYENGKMKIEMVLRVHVEDDAPLEGRL